MYIHAYSGNSLTFSYNVYCNSRLTMTDYPLFTEPGAYSIMKLYPDLLPLHTLLSVLFLMTKYQNQSLALPQNLVELS